MKIDAAKEVFLRQLSGVCLFVILFPVNKVLGDETVSFAPVWSGYSSLSAGEVMKGIGIKGELDHRWVEEGYVGLKANVGIGDRFRIIIGGEAQLSFSFNRDIGMINSYRETEMPRTSFTIKNGEGIYTVGDRRSVELQVEAGFFPYKYNPDARNLGEYLFRSTPYPQFIINNFDRPYADLAGLRIGNTLWKNLHQDILFTSEIHNYPLEDFSLSYIVTYSLPDILNIGLGVDFDRLFSVNHRFTTPSDFPNARFVDKNGKAGYYSFSGTKLMGLLAFDMKCLVPGDFWGKEDLKIFSEVAVLGLRSYAVDTDSSRAYYDKLSERIPLMVGFNFPAFKVLDVLSGQLEYYSNRFPNSYTNSFDNCYPLPIQEDPFNKHDRLKWSIYAKKNIGNYFCIVGQIARDHTIPATHALSEGVPDKTDVTSRHGDWWWTAKTEFHF